MLKAISSRIKQFTAAILIGLLVIAFAMWGIEDVFRPQVGNTVASLGDEEITTREFEIAFRRQLAVLARTEDRQLPYTEAYERGIHREVLQDMITSRILKIDADDLDIGVDGRSARDYVSGIEVLRDELTGKFSEAKLNRILANTNPRISRAEFEADVIRDLRFQQTVPAINGGVIAPVEFAEMTHRFQTQQRKASVLTLTSPAVDPPATPTDDEIRAYIDENPGFFTDPEYRQITIIRLENYDFIPDIEVTEDEVRAQYDYRIELGELGTPETRSVVMITATTEAIAEQVRERLAAGEDPALITNLLGLPEPIIDENVRLEAILVEKAGIAAFAMELGETGIVEGDLGKWYAVSVTDITPAIEPDYDSLKDEIRQDILNNKAQDLLYDVTDILEDTMIEGGSLEDAAEAAEIPYATVDYINSSGFTRDGKRMDGVTGQEGLARDRTILREVFTNDMGYETDLFQTSTGGWAAIRVDGIIDSQLESFDEVRDFAADILTADRIETAMDDLASDLSARVRDGENLEALAAEIGEGARIEEIIIPRSEPPETLGSQITTRLLDGLIGDVVRGPGPGLQTLQIAVLTDIAENTDGLAGQLADTLQQEATSGIISDLGSAYQQAVIADNTLREYPDVVRDILGVNPEE